MADEAKNLVQREIKDLASPAAAALVRPGRKHYEGYRTAQKKIPIKQLFKNLRKTQEKSESGNAGVAPEVDTGLALIGIPRETPDSLTPGDG
ncbi:hypothetical protein Emed_001114 [Eimeria media]